jgi:hypothetical protein
LNWYPDRWLIAVVALGSLAELVYRVAWSDLNDDPSGWIAFVTLWLPTAVILGILLAFAIPALYRRLSNRRKH